MKLRILLCILMLEFVSIWSLLPGLGVVIMFTFLLYAAMLAYKTVSGTKNYKKLVHLTLQFFAFFLSLIGVWAALKFHIDKGIDNFYSLHSWLGLACLFLFSLQVFALIFALLLSPLLYCF